MFFSFVALNLQIVFGVMRFASVFRFPLVVHFLMFRYIFLLNTFSCIIFLRIFVVFLYSRFILGLLSATAAAAATAGCAFKVASKNKENKRRKGKIPAFKSVSVGIYV